ncbi:sigma-54 dependent transcriptional regulator [Bdellovibrionota bacterium FG-1]
MQGQNRPKILLIDDDLDLLRNAQILLRDAYDVLTASSVNAGKATARNNPIDVVVVDLNFEGQENDGLDFMDWAFHEKPELSIVVLSGDRTTKRVVEAMRRPLVDFITKSNDYERDLRVAINKGFDLKQRRTKESGAFTFQTRSPQVKRVLDTVERIARSGVSCTILITGETGAGKEVLAKHYASRMKKKMVTANMATIPRDTAESQLFGHARGSFTGAHADQLGLIAQAHNGIFFLDELGECSLPVQAKLLRAIQEKEIQPLGSKRSMKVDVQFVAATNRDLDEMVKGNDFRLDLLQRINAVTVHLPPLRERPEDIEYYTTTFLSDLCGDQPFAVRASGIDALLAHSWRGNTRELQNVIQKIVILSNKRELDGDTVREALSGIGTPATSAEASPLISRYQQIRTEILTALEKTHGNRTTAAKSLSMHPTTLFRWIKKLGIGNAMLSKPGRPLLSIDPQGGPT